MDKIIYMISLNGYSHFTNDFQSWTRRHGCYFALPCYGTKRADVCDFIEKYIIRRAAL